MSIKKYCKLYCSKRDLYGLATIEKLNMTDYITNFQPLDKQDADKMENEGISSLPMVNTNLLPSEDNGKRIPLAVDRSNKCELFRGGLTFQCLYCNRLSVTRSLHGGFSIYFLMDNSGSMDGSDRAEGSRAVRNLMQSMSTMDNEYSFVPWGSNAGFLFDHMRSISEIEPALRKYENGTAGFSGSTAAHKAFFTVQSHVAKDTKPVVIIFVTDGGFDDERAAKEARNKVLASNEDVNIIAIGVTGAYERNLKEIGTIDSFSKVAGDSRQLTQAFMDVAAFLKKTGKNI